MPNAEKFENINFIRSSHLNPERKFPVKNFCQFYSDAFQYEARKPTLGNQIKYWIGMMELVNFKRLRK